MFSDNIDDFVNDLLLTNSFSKCNRQIVVKCLLSSLVNIFGKLICPKEPSSYKILDCSNEEYKQNDVLEKLCKFLIIANKSENVCKILTNFGLLFDDSIESDFIREAQDAIQILNEEQTPEPTSPSCENFSWTQRGMDIEGDASNDLSGWRVSTNADGSVIAIGAPFNDGNGSDSGHVRVYDWNGSSWTQRGPDIDGEANGDQSGRSVSLSADGLTVAIGATRNNSSKGHVRVYDWDGINWTQRGLDINGESSFDRSGYSVSLSVDGLVVAIGAVSNNENGTNSGHVRVYDWNGSSWTQRGSDIDGDVSGDQLGWSVSLSADGSVVAIGAPFNNSNVKVYDWNGSSWTQRVPDIDGEVSNDQSGYSVSLSADGLVVAIGAITNDGNGINSGHVRVYDWNGSSWTQRGLDIDGEAAGDLSGHSVSLSADGLTVAIGAIFNINANGFNSGHVRVYDWNGSSWTQRGLDIDGEVNADYFGHSVSLSADGSVVAIGAPFNDGINGFDSGHVRVYSYDCIE
jgi:hypothetical protein